MIAISNTSPLIILAKSTYLKNLQRIFKHIIIPEAVFDEIFRKDDITSTMIRELIDSGFIKIFHDCNFVDEDAGMIYERLTSANFWIEKDLFFKVMRG
ncbi:hypothetical protein C5S31_11590 [ANME-1 cluster archaeon GoMg2]|nr:hypothetical protein [ANME-1 cluster archaeon GoMg2]